MLTYVIWDGEFNLWSLRFYISNMGLIIYASQVAGRII